MTDVLPCSHLRTHVLYRRWKALFGKKYPHVKASHILRYIEQDDAIDGDKPLPKSRMHIILDSLYTHWLIRCTTVTDLSKEDQDLIDESKLWWPDALVNRFSYVFRTPCSTCQKKKIEKKKKYP